MTPTKTPRRSHQQLISHRIASVAMRIATVSLFMTVVLLVLLPSVSSANCPAPGANQRCLDQPPVNAASTPETGFAFPAGSTVRFQADGCEQTGGSGATWKRYVNP